MPRNLVVSLTLATSLVLAALPHPSAAQNTPEETAQRFFDALSRLRWERVSEELHTAALDEFHLISRQLVESLRGDSILIQLYDASREEWASWSSREVFERSMAGLTRYARGLMESQVMTDFRVLGTVPEGDTIRHVVYRETTDHMGTIIEAAPTVTLVLEDGAWRVRENAELGVLRVALRGIPIGRRGTHEPFRGHGMEKLLQSFHVHGTRVFRLVLLRTERGAWRAPGAPAKPAVVLRDDSGTAANRQDCAHPAGVGDAPRRCT